MVWANRHVMACDDVGHRIPYLQGSYDEVKDRIRAIYHGPWMFWSASSLHPTPLPFEQIEAIMTTMKETPGNNERME